MTSKQLPYTQQAQRSLYDWAEENGWSELRYDKDDWVWRGFAPNSYIEEPVPVEALCEGVTSDCGLELQKLASMLKRLQQQKAELLRTRDVGQNTINEAESIQAFLSSYPGVIFALERTQVAYDVAVKYAGYTVALLLAAD
jgi:hypothetical protein